MRIILNFLEILLITVAFAVVASYIIRRYELAGRESPTVEGYDAASVAEKALGVAGEVGAVLVCILLYPFGYIMSESSLAKSRPGERPLIMCHGYMHNRSAFFLLRHRLRKAGWNNVVLPNFRPASASVADFAERLSEKVWLVMSRTGCEQVDLVGHSMGGLVVRYFIENLGGSSRVHTAVTLATPNRGTKMAALGLLKTAEQFHPDSPLIRGLSEASSSNASVNMVSIWSDFDNIVLPPENALLPDSCDNLMVRSVGHVALLFSGRAFKQLTNALSKNR